MTAAWAIRLVAAFLLTALSTPLLRRVALSRGFLDHPAPPKTHHAPVPYLGGLALAGSVLAVLLVGADVPSRTRVFAAAAAGLCAIGLLDDRRQVRVTTRLAVQLLCAAAVVGAGLRADVTGLPAVDVPLTIVWIVGITNALNLLDNKDGLAAGTAATAGGAAVALATHAGQPVSTALAAGLTGACLGFLLYNRPPASIFMGDAGSLFLGYSLAVLAVELQAEGGQALEGGWALPLLLLAVPILDTATVTTARRRRGRPISEGGRDHLSHRLIARGASTLLAVAILVVAQAAFATLAVAAGRSWLSGAAAVAGGGVLAAALLAATATVPVYAEAQARPRP
jgi:UDP-GlcNAc:undecaprenyl-phosphate GlcNAc-1-phosphate transferase